jgi:hypothetical protein
MTKLKLILTILSLLITLSISSFYWLSSLVSAVENGHASNTQLNHISQFGLRPLLYQRLNFLIDIDEKWVNIAKALAKKDGEISFTLAKYYLERKKYRAVELWLSQAIRLKHHRARLLLAKIHIDNHKPHLAKALLYPIENDIFALRLLIEISITAGDNTLIARYAEKFKTLSLVNKNQEQQVFYQKLEKYSIVNSANTAQKQTCSLIIAPFATSLENLNYLTRLISSPKLAPFRPYICFSPVKYISKKTLNCLHADNEAIRCDESIWKDQERLISLENRFIVILVEQGGANVNSGILYLDANDTAGVFFHELAHLLGFIDEYPLPSTHFRCLKKQDSTFSHNIAVLPRTYQGSREAVRRRVLAQLPWSKYISSTTPLVRKTAQGWELGTIGGPANTVGGFIAETCSGLNFVAVKPLNQRTAMRYFEETFPALYMQLLLDKPKQFLMPSYLNNVATALEMKITP